MSSAITRLQDWYLFQCDGDWEHSYGVSVGTLDNPGWSLSVDLEGTGLEDVAFAEHRENYGDEMGWLICARTATTFGGNGGPRMLERMIEIFLEWAEASAALSSASTSVTV